MYERFGESKMDLKYVIAGSGATGGSIGAFLAADGQDVTFLARGAQLAALKEKMSASLRQEVETNPTFVETVSKAAQEKADSYFKALLAPYGYQVTVKFTPKTSDNEEAVLSD